MEVLEDLGEWYKVSCNGTVGYVYASYISFQSSDTATAAGFSMESVAGQVGLITGSVVNFRSEPEMEDVNVLTKVRAGDELTIINVSDEWCHATYQGQEGYVKADYISVNGIPWWTPGASSPATASMSAASPPPTARLWPRFTPGIWWTC